MSKPKNNCCCNCNIDTEIDDPIVKVYENDYSKMANKPTFNGVELTGDITLSDLGFSEMTNAELRQSVDDAIGAVIG